MVGKPQKKSSTSGKRVASNQNARQSYCPGTQLTSSTSSHLSTSHNHDRLASGSQPNNLTPERQGAARSQDHKVSSSAVQNLQQASSSRGVSQPRAKYASIIPEPMYHVGAVILNTLLRSHRAHTQQPVPEVKSSRSSINHIRNVNQPIDRVHIQQPVPEVQSSRSSINHTGNVIHKAHIQQSVPEVQSSRSSINHTGNVNHGWNTRGSIDRAELDKMRKDLEDQREIARVLQEELGIANGQFQSQRLAYEKVLREKEKLSVDQARLLAENQDYGQRVSRLAVVVENKKLYVGPQQSDNGISEQFEGLYRRVRDFSFPFLSEHHVPEEVLSRKRFRNILFGVGVRAVEDYQGLLAVKKTRRLMVQGILGYYIRYGVFQRFPEESGESGPKLDHCLSERNSAAIDVLEQTLRQCKSEITQQELNDWRALTLTLISRAETNIPGMITRVEAERKQIKQELVEDLMNWISEWAKPQEDRGRLRQELGVIFEAAFELSLLLRKQRALWFVDFPAVSHDGELRFDPTKMEDILCKQLDEGADEMQKGKTVSLMMFPALYKRGNAHGENYESEICVVKAQVRCIDSLPDQRTGYSGPAVTDHKRSDNRNGHASASVSDYKHPDSWTGDTGVSMTDHRQLAMQHPPYPEV